MSLLFVVFLDVLLTLLQAPSLAAASQSSAGPYSCINVGCHLKVLEGALNAGMLHQPLAGEDVNQACRRCHIDPQASSFERKGPVIRRYEGRYGLKHTVRLTGLSPLTTYYYRIRSADKEGRVTVMPATGSYHFTTIERRPAFGGAAEEGMIQEAEKDRRPPRITDVRVEKIERGAFLKATISWFTDEPSDSQVAYRTEGGPEIRSPLDISLVTKHSVTIFALSPGRRYYFRVISKDASGNTAASKEFNFSTPSRGMGRKQSRLINGFSVLFSALIRPAGAAPAESAGPTIRNLKIVRIDAHSATLYWETDIPCDSLVEYGPKKDIFRLPRLVHPPLRSRKEAAIESCYGCHRHTWEGPSHPVGMPLKADMKVPKGLPLLEDGIITCITCHYPHSGPGRYLLRKDWNRELCVSCHDAENI